MPVYNNILFSPLDTGLSQTVIVVIVVCSVLGTVFISLVIASVALVVYIVKFTKTQPIAHRRLREDRDQPVVYRSVGTSGNDLHISRRHTPTITVLAITSRL